MDDLLPAAPPCGRLLTVWLPWLAAPAFACLPILGCGAAASLRPGHAVATAAPPPLVPVTAVVTALPTGR